MGWFTKKQNSVGAEKMPELPQLPNSPNIDVVLQSSNEPQVQNIDSNISIESISDDDIPPPLDSLPEDFDKDFTKDIQENFKEEDSLPQTSQLRPGMQKSRFSPGMSVRPTINFSAPRTKEMTNDHQPYMPPKPVSIHSPISTQTISPPLIKSMPKRDDSVFIKLEKFQVTMEAFRDVREKIREIEDLLSKTKEIKSREEKELEDWEREIEAIKLKLETIGREISGSEA